MCISSDLIHKSLLYEIDPFVLRLLKMTPLSQHVSLAAGHWLLLTLSDREAVITCQRPDVRDVVRLTFFTLLCEPSGYILAYTAWRSMLSEATSSTALRAACFSSCVHFVTVLPTVDARP